MVDEPTPLHTLVGDIIELPPDQILREAVKADLTEVFVVGVTEEGALYMAGSHGAPQSAWLLLRAMHDLPHTAMMGDPDAG